MSSYKCTRSLSNRCTRNLDLLMFLTAVKRIFYCKLPSYRAPHWAYYTGVVHSSHIIQNIYMQTYILSYSIAWGQSVVRNIQAIQNIVWTRLLLLIRTPPAAPDGDSRARRTGGKQVYRGTTRQRGATSKEHKRTMCEAKTKDMSITLYTWNWDPFAGTAATYPVTSWRPIACLLLNTRSRASGFTCYVTSRRQARLQVTSHSLM